MKNIIGEGHTIDYKDTLSYFTVLIDNNVRNWICRFYFDGPVKRLQFNGEERFDIEAIKDIEKYNDKIVEITKNILKALDSPSEASSVGEKPQWYSLEKLIEANTSGTKPQKMKLPDGEEKPVKKWVDIVEYTVQWLYNKKKLAKKNCPIPDYSGKNRYCVNVEPVHPSGKEYKYVMNIGELCIETNYASENHLRNIKEIFQAIGEKPSIKIFV